MTGSVSGLFGPSFTITVQAVLNKFTKLEHPKQFLSTILESSLFNMINIFSFLKFTIEFNTLRYL